MAQSKGTLIHQYVSVPETEYLHPDKVHARRIRARNVGRKFKSGLRRIKFDGITIVVTVITIRDAML